MRLGWRFFFFPRIELTRRASQEIQRARKVCRLARLPEGRELST